MNDDPELNINDYCDECWLIVSKEITENKTVALRQDSKSGSFSGENTRTKSDLQKKLGEDVSEVKLENTRTRSQLEGKLENDVSGEKVENTRVISQLESEPGSDVSEVKLGTQVKPQLESKLGSDVSEVKLGTQVKSQLESKLGSDVSELKLGTRVRSQLESKLGSDVSELKLGTRVKSQVGRKFGNNVSEEKLENTRVRSQLVTKSGNYFSGVTFNDNTFTKTISQNSLPADRDLETGFFTETFSFGQSSTSINLSETKRSYEWKLCLNCLIEVHWKDFGKNLLRNVSGSGDGLLKDSHKCEMIPIGKNHRRTKFAIKCSDPDCPKFKFWKIIDSGGIGWKVEPAPEDCLPIPVEVEAMSCFVTSGDLCSKEQLVELSRRGLSPRVMDEIRPDLEVSEWYAGRWDSTSRYGFKVSLLDEKLLMMNVYGECKTLEPPESSRWQKVTYTFRCYDPGVRYVLFHHGGMGIGVQGSHRGSKMAGASVIARVPDSFKTTEEKFSIDY